MIDLIPAYLGIVIVGGLISIGIDRLVERRQWPGWSRSLLYSLLLVAGVFSVVALTEYWLR